MKSTAKLILAVATAGGLFTAGACSDGPSASAPATDPAFEATSKEFQGIPPDFATTPEIRRALSAELARADSVLSVLGESLVAGLGPEIEPALREIGAEWRKYRHDECALLSSVFQGGTYAPVVELQCYVFVSNNRINMILESYDFLEFIAELKRRQDAEMTNQPDVVQ